MNEEVEQPVQTLIHPVVLFQKLRWCISRFSFRLECSVLISNAECR